MESVAIIGGGAAGLAAAAAAGEAARKLGKQLQITVYEASDKVGRPILASGNGRCNFSNANISASAYHNAEFVTEVLAAFEGRMSANNSGFRNFPNGVVRFFYDHGLLYREESEGRLYPQANKSSVVLDVLRTAANAVGVEIKTDAQARTIEPPRSEGKPFTLRMNDGSFERASKVIFAAGGKVPESAIDAPLKFEKPRPVLGPVATNTELVRKLDNIRVRCAVSLLRNDKKVHSEQGEVLFRKYGVSGIATFNLSRLSQNGDVLSIDFFPKIAENEMAAFLRDRIEMLTSTFGKAPNADQLLQGMLLPQVASVVLEYAGVSAQKNCDESALKKLTQACKNFQLEYKGIGDAKQCQVHRGGFCVSNVNAETLEARTVPGLYIVGEALDVDGPCGGYNLHWAFATGIQAGVHAATTAK